MFEKNKFYKLIPRNLANCGRRKRAITEKELDRLGFLKKDILPSRKVTDRIWYLVLEMKTLLLQTDVTEDLEADEGDEKEGRVLNYWMTTTTTVTSHSYTVTSTFASLLCTYDGFTYATCGR